MSRLQILVRHARRELLRGPFGLPFVLPRRRLIQRLTLSNPASRKLWARLQSLTFLGLKARKALFRALYNAPFGPGDAAAPHRVFARHVALARKLTA